MITALLLGVVVLLFVICVEVGAAKEILSRVHAQRIEHADELCREIRELKSYVAGLTGDREAIVRSERLNHDILETVALQDYPRSVLQIVCGMKNDLRGFFKTFRDFRFRCIATSDLNGTEPSSSIFNHKHIPHLPDSKERAGGDLQDIWTFPDDDPRIHPVSIPETIRWINEVCDYVGSLLFDSKRGYLGEAVRLYGAHPARNGAAPPQFSMITAAPGLTLTASVERTSTTISIFLGLLRTTTGVPNGTTRSLFSRIRRMRQRTGDRIATSFPAWFC